MSSDGGTPTEKRPCDAPVQWHLNNPPLEWNNDFSQDDTALHAE